MLPERPEAKCTVRGSELAGVPLYCHKNRCTAKGVPQSSHKAAVLQRCTPKPLQKVLYHKADLLQRCGTTPLYCKGVLQSRCTATRPRVPQSCRVSPQDCATANVVPTKCYPGVPPTKCHQGVPSGSIPQSSDPSNSRTRTCPCAADSKVLLADPALAAG